VVVRRGIGWAVQEWKGLLSRQVIELATPPSYCKTSTVGLGISSKRGRGDSNCIDP